jgi:hypothetical protein
MLRLLSSHFPGSYLIRAQEGELRYLAAFNNPSAAAAWCITLHVSALWWPAIYEGKSHCGAKLSLSGLPLPAADQQPVLSVTDNNAAF